MSSSSKTPAAAGSRGNGIPRVIVATTALLTFISFWRAAAIVLNDLASSAYYAGGEAEGYIGKTAPWFILAIMLFSYAVRAVYVESCSMFVRGGVYRAVKQSLGGTLAKFSVSALMFDYILTGPISGVAAGQYLAGLISELLQYSHLGNALTPNEVSFIAAGFAILVTVYFWWENTKGIPESSDKALHHHEAGNGDGGSPHRMVYLHRDFEAFAAATLAAPAQSASERQRARLACG